MGGTDYIVLARIQKFQYRKTFIILGIRCVTNCPYCHKYIARVKRKRYQATCDMVSPSRVSGV